jgi:DNA-binding transcriptional MerR regulator
MQTIGDFAKLTRIPVKTLRYYDEIGLLCPARSKHGTGYRSYSAEHFERLNRILVLKDLGCSLSEIRMLLAENVSAQGIRDMIRAKHEALERHVDQERARLARAVAQLDLLEHTVAVRDAGPWLIASVRDTLASYGDVEVLFEELDRVTGARRSHRQRGVVWHACAPGHVDCEAFEILPSRIDVTGRVRVYETAPRRVASLVYHGDANYPAAFHAVRAWMAASGVAMTGPKCEMFLEPGVTDVQFPIH